MRFLSTVVTISAIAGSALAASPLISIQKFNGETTGNYIVKLKDGASKSDMISRIPQEKVTHDWSIINGFAGDLDTNTLDNLRANPEVDSIYEDGIMSASAIQTNAPWGLARISSKTSLSGSNASALKYTYSYPDNKAGSGVDIYILDSGVLTTHSTFGGRARWGATFGGHADADGDGHGTHCAGIAAGADYGVAKRANIIAVKVLSDKGLGSTSTILSGLDWVKTQAASTRKPSVISMSFGGSASQPIDDAVGSLTSAGVHVVVSAGNKNIDASNASPARAPSAITVGSSTIDDARAPTSNYGPVVDIFAPGRNIISAGNADNNATLTKSGTSMAAPHISGLVAYLIARDGNIAPADMKTKLQGLAQKNVLTSIPAGTVNLLAQNH